MRFARTITAFLIALSVAMLPVAGPASFALNAAEQSASAAMADAEMSAAMDCCPDYEKPCDQGRYQCQSMAVCVLFVNLAGVTASSLIYPALSRNPLLALADRALPPHGGSPPFRPPRV